MAAKNHWLHPYSLYKIKPALIPKKTKNPLVNEIIVAVIIGE